MLYASNFSIGVNLFFAVNKYLAQRLANLKMYMPEVTEWHHMHKKDKPSGTAVTIAAGIIQANHDYHTWHLADVEPNAHGSIPIHAFREGEIIGTHTVNWQGEIDQISITHEAHNREGFALGAIMAAKYIHDKKGIFTMEQVIG